MTRPWLLQKKKNGELAMAVETGSNAINAVSDAGNRIDLDQVMQQDCMKRFVIHETKLKMEKIP